MRKQGRTCLFIFMIQRQGNASVQSFGSCLGTFVSKSHKGCNRSHGISPKPLLLNPRVLFCSAACKTREASFTMRPHPDVGEGASPQLA